MRKRATETEAKLKRLYDAIENGIIDAFDPLLKQFHQSSLFPYWEQEGTEKADKLDVLLAFVDIYEAKRWPIETDESFDPIDVLSYAIEELGRTQAELAELFGSRSRASEILSRRRALTVDMIHKVSEAWKIPAELLVRPYRIERAA
jgi:HTH-type transcriptional regulator / antitoxin HigA